MTEATAPGRRAWRWVRAIRIGSAALAWCSVAALAGASVDANVASQAELEAVRGVGPGLAEAILAERRKAPFKDWPDFVARVKGVGAASAARLSAAGLTVEAGKLPATAK